MSDPTDSGSKARTPAETQPQGDSQQESGSENQQVNSLAGSALVEAAKNDPVASEALRRYYQSNKDRGVAAANKAANKALDEVQRLANHLNIPDDQLQQARREMLLEDLYQEKYGDNSQPETGGGQGAEAQTPASSNNPVDLEAVKKANKDLDFNDNKILAAYQKYANDQDAFLLELGKIRLAGSTKPQASPTEAVTQGSGTPATADEQNDLRQAYNNQVENLRKEYRGAIPPHILSDLKADYRKKGLDNLW